MDDLLQRPRSYGGLGCHLKVLARGIDHRCRHAIRVNRNDQCHAIVEDLTYYLCEDALATEIFWYRPQPEPWVKQLSGIIYESVG